MRKSAWLLVGALLMLPGLACSKKESSQTLRSPAAEKPQEAEPDAAEIKATTPDDLGPAATVVSPMAIWMRNAKLRRAQREAAVPQSGDPQPIDHFALTALVLPQVLVHKTFPVRHYAKFEFVVPAHIHNPRLRGSFQSLVKSGGGSSTGQAADIDLLLLDEQAFNDFVHGESGSPTEAAGPSDSQQVEWGLASTFDEPSKYYLVFVNPADGQQTRFVQADFTVSFE